MGKKGVFIFLFVVLLASLCFALPDDAKNVIDFKYPSTGGTTIINNTYYTNITNNITIYQNVSEIDPRFIAENSSLARTGSATCPAGTAVQNVTTSTGGIVTQCVTFVPYVGAIDNVNLNGFYLSNASIDAVADVDGFAGFFDGNVYIADQFNLTTTGVTWFSSEDQGAYSPAKGVIAFINNTNGITNIQGFLNWSFIKNAPSFLTGNPFNQILNTTSNVTFANVTITGNSVFQNNVSFDWIFGKINWSNVQNAPSFLTTETDPRFVAENNSLARTGSATCGANAVVQNVTTSTGGIVSQCFTLIFNYNQTTPAIDYVNTNYYNKSTSDARYLNAMQDFFLTNSSNPDVSGYFVMNETVPQMTTVRLNRVSGITDGQAIASWMNSKTNITFLPAGTFAIILDVQKVSGTQTLRVYGNLSKRNATGEYQLGLTEQSSLMVNLIDSSYELTGTIPDINLNVNDKLVMKIMANVTLIGTAPSLEFQVEGNKDSRLDFPVANIKSDDPTKLALDGSNANQNINISVYNFTASWLFGSINWSWIQNVPSFLTGNPFNQVLNTSSNVTFGNITVSKNSAFLENVTANWFKGSLNWSDVQNEPTFLTAETDPKFTAENTTLARNGTCANGKLVMNTTTTASGGVQCVDGSYWNKALTLDAANITSGTLAVARGGTGNTNGIIGPLVLGTTSAPACTNGGGTTTFIGAGGGVASTTETLVARYVSPANNTLANLYIKIGGNVPASQTATFMLMKNGATCAITCAVAAGASTCTNTTGTCAVVTNDLVDLRVVCAGGTTALTASVSASTTIT